MEDSTNRNQLSPMQTSISSDRTENHRAPPAASTAGGRVMAAYVLTKLPNASTINAMIPTQNAYVLTYWIGVNVLTIASTAINTATTNIHIEGA
jgi:hypothetical protein